MGPRRERNVRLAVHLRTQKCQLANKSRRGAQLDPLICASHGRRAELDDSDIDGELSHGRRALDLLRNHPAMCGSSGVPELHGTDVEGLIDAMCGRHTYADLEEGSSRAAPQGLLSNNKRAPQNAISAVRAPGVAGSSCRLRRAQPRRRCDAQGASFRHPSLFLR